MTSPDCFLDADKENLSSPAPSCDNCFTTGHADGSSPDDLLDKGVDILDRRVFAGDCCGKDDAEFGSRRVSSKGARRNLLGAVVDAFSPDGRVDNGEDALDSTRVCLDALFDDRAAECDSRGSCPNVVKRKLRGEAVVASLWIVALSMKIFGSGLLTLGTKQAALAKKQRNKHAIMTSLNIYKFTRIYMYI